MNLTLILLPVVGLGALLFLLGVALVLKRMTTLGIITALLGAVVAAVPVLGIVYASIAMQ